MAEPKRLIEYIDGETLEADEFTDEKAAFETFRSSFESDAMGTLRVSKIKVSNLTGHPMSTKAAYCFAAPIDRYSFDELVEFIRETYGGGLYRLVGVQSGKAGVKFNKLLELTEEQKPKSGPQNPALGTVVDQVGSLVQNTQDRMEAMFQRMQPARTDTGAQIQDLIKSITPFVAALAPIVTGIMGRPVPPTPSLTEKLAEFAAIKELLSGLTGNDSGGAESNFYDLAGKAMGALAPVLGAAVASGKLGLAAPTAVAESAPHIIEHAPQSTGAPPMSKIPDPDAALKNQVNILVGQAMMGADAAGVADMVVDMTPDDKLDALAAFIRDPQVVSRMARVDARVTQYRAWFDALRENLLRLILEIESEHNPAASAAPEPGPSEPAATAPIANAAVGLNNH